MSPAFSPEGSDENRNAHPRPDDALAAKSGSGRSDKSIVPGKEAGHIERGFIMAELTRRNMIAGSALAVAGLAAGDIAAKPALAASERVSEPGFNAGWGDTEVDQEVLDTPFGELVDSCFNYSWSYTAEFEPQPERDHVLVITSSAAIGGNGDHIAQTVVDEIGMPPTSKSFTCATTRSPRS